MAPSIHPPCTPSSQCQKARCHPRPPPCEWPEQCLRNTTLLNIPPCASAASIMATRSKSRCIACGKYGTPRPVGVSINDPRRVQYIQNYLRRKDHEQRLRRYDELTGARLLTDFQRSRGSFRNLSDCCAGHGHRGRVKLLRLKKRRRYRRRERRRIKKMLRRGRRNRKIKSKKRKRYDPYGNPHKVKRRKCVIL